MKQLNKLKDLKLGAYSPDLGHLPALAAEALGTAALVFAAAGSGAATGAIGGLSGSTASGPLAVGLVIAIIVLLFGPISGAHFNPAVSLGAVLAGRLPKARLIPYILAQLAGGLAACLLLRLLIQSSLLGTSTTQMGFLSATLLEALLTAWLVFVILSVTEKDRSLGTAAFAIGGTVAANALWAGHLCGASMNPVRSLAPAIAAMDFSDIWIYLWGPMLGGFLGAKLYAFFRALK